MFRICFGVGAALTLVISAAAQTKISGTVECGKPEISQVAEVGDRAGHMLILTQGKCAWSKPIEMEGLQSKDDTGTGVNDVFGNTSHDRGYDVTVMSNGDKAFVSNQGSSKINKGVLESGSGKWTFTGGTGKLRGLKGGGTFTLKGAADGKVTIEIEGEYSIAAPEPKKKSSK